MVLFYGEEFYVVWMFVCEVLFSGILGFELVFGEDFYSYLKCCLDVGWCFLLVMKVSNLVFYEIFRFLDFCGCSFVDVGGGFGELIKVIL